MPMWETVAQQIGHSTGRPFSVVAAEMVGGGCINATYRLRGEENSFFVKTNAADRLEMFAAEAEGLIAIAATGTIRVPEPIVWGVAGGHAYLVLEYLALGSGDGGERLGRQLAALHRATADRFGWHRDNTIGSTPQVNDWDSDWPRFWGGKRLGYQRELAARNGAGRGLLNAVGAVRERLGGLFTDYRPKPSLLHGDLWGGNAATTRDGEPVIFDPATYYGDREADLAMTELFGGFGARFRAAYEEEWPLDPGYRVRKLLYNLYHILNHFNMFGGGYGAQAETMAGRLLSELR